MNIKTLMQKANSLYHGATDPNLRSALATMGLTDENLVEFKELLDATEELMGECASSLRIRKDTIKARNAKLHEVTTQDVNLSKLLRTIEPDSSYLKMLQTETQYHWISKPGEGEDAQPVVRKVYKDKPTDLKYKRNRFRLILKTITKFKEPTLTTLARYGWGPEVIQGFVANIHEFLSLCLEAESATRQYYQDTADSKEFRDNLAREYRLYRINIEQMSKNHPMRVQLVRIGE